MDENAVDDQTAFARYASLGIHQIVVVETGLIVAFAAHLVAVSVGQHEIIDNDTTCLHVAAIVQEFKDVAVHQQRHHGILTNTTCILSPMQ
jgi:hypothetical protein